MYAAQGPILDLPGRFFSKPSVYLFKVRSMHTWAQERAHEFIHNFMGSLSQASSLLLYEHVLSPSPPLPSWSFARTLEI